MNNVYKRGENYYIDFWFHGKRHREMIGPSRKGAEKIIAKRKAEIAENKFLDKKKELPPVNFHEFAKEYMTFSKANKKPSSFKSDLQKMRMLDRAFGGRNLGDITTWQIEKWKSKRKETVRMPDATLDQKEGTWRVEYLGWKGVRRTRTFKSKNDAEIFFAKCGERIGPYEVNRELSLLKHIFTKAIEWGKLKDNPAKKVKLLKGEVKRVRFLMPDEIQILLSNCADHLRPIVVVAANTGMRKSEILNLEWDRVNLDQGIITLLDTKNHERRDIPMNRRVKEVLTEMEKRKDGPHVFCNGDGGTFANVRRSFDTAVRRSGIRDFRFHDLRHTFASNLVMAGVDLNTVRELLGHKTLAMTLRYSHLAPDYKTRAVNVLDDHPSLESPRGETQSKVVSISGLNR